MRSLVAIICNGRNIRTYNTLEGLVRFMIAFINTFLSYIVLMLIILAVAACGFALGLFLRKNKNKKAVLETEEKE